MPMSTVAFIAGALFILIAVVGGGLNIKEINIAPILMPERIGLGVIGAFFILYGFLVLGPAERGVEAGSQTPAASQAPPLFELPPPLQCPPLPNDLAIHHDLAFHRIQRSPT